MLQELSVFSLNTDGLSDYRCVINCELHCLFINGFIPVRIRLMKASGTDLIEKNYCLTLRILPWNKVIRC